MSYTPTTWHGGDVLSAEAMNKIEQGIASSAFLEVAITVNGDSYVCNKTWQEIYNAFPYAYVVFTSEGLSKGTITRIYYDEDGKSYKVIINSNRYSTNSSSGYPSFALIS